MDLCEGRPLRASVLKDLSRDHRALLAIIIALFVCRALAADAIVPHWQGPDEPSHFGQVKLLTMPDGGTAAARVEVERRVLQSMARHRWWELYQQPTPDPVPRAFVEVDDGSRLAPGSLARPTYFWLGAGALRLVSPSNLESEYRVLRIVSVILSAAALICGWAGTRLLFGVSTATGAVSIAALHPQFLLSTVSVNPDVLINLCGAFMWWQAARLQQTKALGRAISVVLIVVTAVVAAMAKRNGIPLLIIAGVLSILAFVRSVPHTNRRVPFAAAAILTIVGTGTVVYASWSWIDVVFSRLLASSSDSLIVRQSAEDMTLASLLPFLGAAIDTAWLVAGWLRFPAPELWLWTARLLTIAGLLGAVRLLVSSPSVRRSLSLAWLFVGVQAAPLLGIAFIGGAVPQGRYLFSVLVPATVLLWLGLHRWVPAAARPYAAPTIVCIFAALDVTGFTMVLIPAYLQ